jgi:hypothetical protein
MELFLTAKTKLSLRWFMRTLMIFLSFIYLFHRKQIVLQESAINLVFVWKLVSIRLRVDRTFRQTREQRKDYLHNAVKSAPPPTTGADWRNPQIMILTFLALYRGDPFYPVRRLGDPGISTLSLPTNSKIPASAFPNR